MNNTNITNKIAEEIVFDPCVEKEQEPTISFLFGSGFSIPAGLPGVKELNKRMGEIKKEEISISPDQKSSFLNGREDPYILYNRVEKLFVQEFLEFYNKEVLSENECFDYESFYDFYLVYLNGIHNKVFQKNKVFRTNKALIKQFCADFNKKYPEFVPEKDPYNRVKDFNRTFNQLLASRLRCLNYLENKTTISSYPPYDFFINLLKDLLPKNILKIHTLNHDLLFDWLGAQHYDLYKHFSDGFELEGSPYYGDLKCSPNDKSLQKKYKIKLERYTGRYTVRDEHNTMYEPARLSLFKLHGSINNFMYRTNEEKEMYVRIKSNYDIEEYFKEVFDPENKSHFFKSLWEDVSPDFLCGRTEKTKKYSQDKLYRDLFERFEENLQKSELLIVIGYGFQDCGINGYLVKNFLDKGKKMIVIDPKNPNKKMIDKYKAIHIRCSIADLKDQNDKIMSFLKPYCT